jgi:hypothetical protein
MTVSAEHIRAVLMTYHQVASASWPQLHPAMVAHSATWGAASAEDLQRELDGYLQESSQSSAKVRLFWKHLPNYTFAGGNAALARDAGLPLHQLLGMDDFNPRLPWTAQAAKYREDDEAVVQSAKPKLNIIERQRSAAGEVSWLRVSKAPIKIGTRVIGLLGMYGTLEADEGRRLYAEQES